MKKLYSDEYMFFGFTCDGGLYLSPLTGGYGIPEFIGDPNAPLVEQYGKMNLVVWEAFAEFYALSAQKDNRLALLIANRLIDGFREAQKEMLSCLVGSGYAPDALTAWERLCEERPKGYHLAWRIHY